MDASNSRQIITSFLSQLTGSGDLPDELVVDYVTGALTQVDESDDGECISDLEEVLPSLCPAFEALESSDRLTKLMTLWEQVKNCEAAQQQTNTSLRNKIINSLDSRTGPLPDECCGENVDATNVDQENASESERELIEHLSALCPHGTSKSFLSSVLSDFKGNVQAAADFLLECNDLVAMEATFQRQQREYEEKMREDERQREKSRREVVARFALQEVREISGNRRTKLEHKPDLLEPEAKETKPKVRYLNGAPVHVQKGQKYVVESTKEEWDGGSRGKVYTKGKRGKGFT